MVLLESLRLYPPTWIYVRMAQEDDILPSGFVIPRGAKLYLCQYVVHRNRRYFPDPERFDPSRFTDEARRLRPKYAYFPFGGGPRVCIGQSLAMMEGVLAIASIANRFRLALVPGQTIVPVPGMTLHPAGEVLMQLSRRSGQT
jgi:cytochrome P450